MGHRLVVGWREWVCLPAWGISRVRAKMDTGAKFCTLHAEQLQVFRKHGRAWVSFKSIGGRQINAAVVGVRRIRSSNGICSRRLVVATDLAFGGRVRRVLVSLEGRSRMGTRLLVGRMGLEGCVVDPMRTDLLGGDVDEVWDVSAVKDCMLG